MEPLLLQETTQTTGVGWATVLLYILVKLHTHKP
jgi:hypothetical protein